MWSVEVEGNPIVAYTFLVTFIIVSGGCLWVTAARRYRNGSAARPLWQRVLASGWAEAAGLLGFPLALFGLTVSIMVEGFGRQAGVTGTAIAVAVTATTLIWIIGVRRRQHDKAAEDDAAQPHSTSTLHG